MRKAAVRTGWYTAVAKTMGGKAVPISGPYKTKKAADELIALPGSRDRLIAEAIDQCAHFYHYLTILAEATLKPIIDDPRVREILETKGIALV